MFSVATVNLTLALLKSFMDTNNLILNNTFQAKHFVQWLDKVLHILCRQISQYLVSLFRGRTLIVAEQPWFNHKWKFRM